MFPVFLLFCLTHGNCHSNREQTVFLSAATNFEAEQNASNCPFSVNSNTPPAYACIHTTESVETKLKIFDFICYHVA